MSAKNVVIVLCLAALLCGSAFGQDTSSNVMGAVTDPSGAAIPNIKVELKDVGTGATHTTNTTAEGIFRFNSIVPGQYTLNIEAQGFKAYAMAGIRLASSETRDLGRIPLTIGALAEQVAVTAEATPVQTASSEKSSLVDATQLTRIALRGRDMFGMLQVLPGITGVSGGETTGTSLPGAINGGGNKNFTVDGVTDMDTGSNGTVHFEPTIDSIAEIRVLSSNYQAEYGRNANGTISVITKGGSREFHGTGYETYRHESMNANSWANIRNGTARSLYRYNVPGYSVGGPIFVPRVFNTNKQRLFFFFSQEYTRQRPSTTNTYAKMPTALEKAGDFSQTVNSNGALVVIKDPTTGLAFPGNKIADLTRIDPVGLSVLNFFPGPNRCDLVGNATGCYNETDSTQLNSRNYFLSSTAAHPRRNDTARADLNLSSKLLTFFRWSHDYDNTQTFNPNYGIKNAAGVRAPVIWNHPNPGHGFAVGITYTVSPTMVNEFTFGKSYNTWDFYPTPDVDTQWARSQIPGLPHWYDSSKLPNDPLFYKDYLPYMAFSGGQQAGAPSFGNSNVNDAEPRTNWNDIYSFTDSLSRVMGKHNFKAGAYYERTNKVQGKGAFYSGNYNFGSSTSSTLDTQDGFANALLGYVTSYQEGTKTIYDTWFTNLEPYIQDNWRVTKRLTLDVGARIYITTPYTDHNGTFSAFNPANYSASAHARLYTYGKDANGKQIAVDPLDPTNTKASQYIGLFVQNSSGTIIGNPASGWTNYDGSTASYSTRTVIPSIRLGFAYDLFGTGKTAIRGGFGQFYNRFDVNQVYEQSGLPPYSYIPQIQYTTLTQLATQPKALGPLSSVNYMTGPQKVEGTVNGSFGVQQNVGFGTVVEASYVGAFRRHTLVRYDVNHLGLFPYLNSANWVPGTTTQKSDIFLRPIQGEGSLNAANFSGSTDYNSLQVSVNKRPAHGLSYGLAYTFMKLISTTGQTYFFDMNTRSRAMSGVPHLLVVNYNYEVPGLGKRFHMKALGAVTDGWTISGITTFSSGGWGGVSSSYSTTLQYGQTGGSPDGSRINIIGPVAAVGGRSQYNQFNVNAFAPPPPCTPTFQSMACFGSAASAFLLGPGWSNWDMTFAKQIPIGLGERRKLMFRGEFYNIWNHLEFNGMNTSTQYVLATGARVTSGNNATFGQLNGAAAPRRVALTLRLEF